eukprot:COSAG02_NODE_7548_length_2966_cov_5.574119_2_plen_234_part_00
MRRSGYFGLVVLLAALATRGSAQECTDAQEGCATSGTSCSQFASGRLACGTAEPGWYLFLDDLPQRCAEVEGAASVTCEAADNSRAVCASTRTTDGVTRPVVYHHTDNSARGVSDTCTECLEQPNDQCIESEASCMAGTCTGSDDCDALNDASVCEGTAGCTYTPPSFRRCRTAADGYYTDANDLALGARPFTHSSFPLAAASSDAARCTLRSMRGGGKCRIGDMHGRRQQPR